MFKELDTVKIKSNGLIGTVVSVSDDKDEHGHGYIVETFTKNRVSGGVSEGDGLNGYWTLFEVPEDGLMLKNSY